MERFKALVDEWRKEGDDWASRAADEAFGLRKDCYKCDAAAAYHKAEQLESAILATENEAFMESIVPGFRDLDDVVATDAAQAVAEQTVRAG